MNLTFWKRLGILCSMCLLICTQCINRLAMEPSSSTVSSKNTPTPQGNRLAPSQNISTLNLLSGEKEMYTPQLLVSLPWGMESDQMPPLVRERRYSDIVSTLIISTTQSDMLRFRPDLPIYVDSLFQIYVLGIDFSNQRSHPTEYSLFQFATNGDLQHRFNLKAGQVDDNYRVIDFAVEAGNIYILDRFKETKSQHFVFRLRKISLSENIVLWTWTETKSLETANQIGQILLQADGTLYVVSKSGLLIEIDSVRGREKRSLSLNNKISFAHLTSNGVLYALRPATAKQDRAIIAYNIRDEKYTVFSNKVSISSVFLGVDDKKNVYTCSDSRIVQLTTSGDRREYSLEGVVLDTESGIWLSFWDFESQELLIHNWDIAGNYAHSISLTLPDSESISKVLPKLIQVDKTGFYVSSIALYHYSYDGILQAKQPIIDENPQITAQRRSQVLFPIESRVGPCSFGHIDREGRFYLPITDPEGFRILRLDLCCSHQTE